MLRNRPRVFLAAESLVDMKNWCVVHFATFKTGRGGPWLAEQGIMCFCPKWMANGCHGEYRVVAVTALSVAHSRTADFFSPFIYINFGLLGSWQKKRFWYFCWQKFWSKCCIIDLASRLSFWTKISPPPPAWAGTGMYLTYSCHTPAPKVATRWLPKLPHLLLTMKSPYVRMPFGTISLRFTCYGSSPFSPNALCGSNQLIVN